ncbi:PDT-domain-containing protein [Lojkania enalia]|uniref:prephenate dehydratase n=1 Tax=Lojkania enalia TaxID=147567 RepID=A0A9P4N6U5_9PLEO|nr:PDT-domain-containing protein [Didymosphaeria enalia]
MAEDEKNFVAFLGPKASYTHQATLSAFPSPPYTLTPLLTIEDVFAAVQFGTVTRGVVPFENSTNGSVVFTLDLFADLNNKYPDILVCDEVYVPVSHCLLGHDLKKRSSQNPSGHASNSLPETGSMQIPSRTLPQPIIESPLSSGTITPTHSDPHPRKPRAPPLADLSLITKLYSHPQAWGQCHPFLNTYLKGVERQDVSSTSRAAEIVAHDESGNSAAVSSGLAAEVWGLDVLARGIEERGDNCTRFFVLGKRKGEEEYVGTEAERTAEGGGEGMDNTAWKTLVSFTVDHENPGSLAHSLAVFEKYGLNLTSINTRPSSVRNWNYIFFVEIQGRRCGGGGREGPVNQALEELGKACRGWRWLGCERRQVVVRCRMTVEQGSS